MMADTLRIGSVLLGGGVIAGLLWARHVNGKIAKLSNDRSVWTATIDRMSEGVSVLDQNFVLVASNQSFQELYNLPESLHQSGTTMKDVIRFQADRGDFGPLDDIDGFIESRLKDFSAVEGDITEEKLPNNRTVEIRRNRTPDGLVISLYMDVSERVQTNEALRRSEERYALAATGANDGLWDWEINEGRLYTSSRWQEMLGLSADAITSQASDWFDRVHPSDSGELQINIRDHLDGRTDHMQAEFRILHEDGAYLWILARAIAVRDDKGEAIRLTGSFTDVTERHRAEETLLRNALYDTVTGLPNRALFLDRINQERRRHADLSVDHFAVLLLDLDRFKVINDSLGHDLGDALLIDVARRLEGAVDHGDSVARLAGDEFGILMTGVSSKEQALDTVHWLQADLAAAFSIGNQDIFTSVCVGIALPSQGFASAEEMLRAADIAMYKAKDKGQSSVAVFDPQMQSRAITQMQMENDLRRAVDRDEIEMFYQPIVDLRSGKISGVEALARWRHPDRGTVVPADFIPLAEDTGLINAIGTAALRLACRQMHAWEIELGDDAPGTMGVNLSSRQLQDPDMVREVELILSREQVDGARLKLEVTESMIMMNPEITSRILVELKQLGVALSIDDFGTGYSSLSYLHRFPFDTLKIDRSFVVSMEEKTENMEIIRSIALLAHNLGMDIVAEGVESERHLRRLVELKCEYGQGFYFSTPQPADRISDMIRAGKSWLMPVV